MTFANKEWLARYLRRRMELDAETQSEKMLAALRAEREADRIWEER